MNSALAYLLNFLEDEFSSIPDVRVRVAPIKKREKSPDLEQNFDEFSSSVSGVIVRTKKREYFFPESWITRNERAEIDQLITEIRNALDLY